VSASRSAQGRTLALGTRGSDLAQAQARAVARALEARGHAVELHVVRTSGDADAERPFAQVGAAGIFVRELERALLERRVDLAVHSYKDLPSQSPPELAIAAVPAREDARDRLLARPAALDESAPYLPLASGARVGTAAARRAALLRHLRPDLAVVHVRGNVPRRVAKLRAGECDALLLAAAGLDRLDAAAARGECAALERGDVSELPLDPERFVPAPAQGAVAVQVRADDGELRAALAPLDDAAAHRCVRAERALLELVHAGCEVPFGAWCQPIEGAVEAAASGELELLALLEVGTELRHARRTGADPTALARAVYAELWPERAHGGGAR
jgi:hydroxymethylbilane synthase